MCQQYDRRCVQETRVDAIIDTSDVSLVGRHHNVVPTTAKVLQCKYYWPKLYQAANSLVRKCVQCQKQGGISRRHELSLTPILKMELFDACIIGFMGLFVCSYGNKFILVAMDYVFKMGESGSSI